MDSKKAYLLTCRREDQNYPYFHATYTSCIDAAEEFNRMLISLAATQAISFGSDAETVLWRLGEYKTSAFEDDERLRYEAKIFAPAFEKNVYVQLITIYIIEGRLQEGGFVTVKL